MHKTGKHIVNLAKAAEHPDSRTGTTYFRRQACGGATVISEASVTLDGSSIKGRAYDPLRVPASFGLEKLATPSVSLL